MSDKNSIDDGDILEDDGLSGDIQAEDGDSTSPRTSLATPDEELSGQMDGRTGDPMANDEPHQSHHTTSAFSDTDASSLARYGLDPSSVEARMQGWQLSGNDEPLPSIEQDDQPGLGGYRSLFTAQAFSTVLTETANDTVGAERSHTK